MENNQNNQTTETIETETVTMSKADFDKKIQSETDKVRTEYSKKIKDYEAKIKELTPIEKSQTEIDLETRLAAVEAREKAIKLNDDLKSKGIPTELADYLNPDVDVDSLATAFNSLTNAAVEKYIADNGYVPTNHKSGDEITKEQFKKMTYEQREKLYTENPELYKSLSS